MEYPKYKVTVSCMTYNHSKYITDAMNGFTMQQTSFPFVCTIVDDASTDGEQEVIKKYVEDNFDFSEGSVAYQKETDYAHITYAQHKSNKNCYFAVLYLKENHYSQRKPKMGYLSEWRDMCEYEALCEGDDYWIVPDKLEKQVDVLDCHPNINLCAHAQVTIHAITGQTIGETALGKNMCIYPIEDVILGEGGYVGTNTIMIRTTINLEIPEFRRLMDYDYTLQIHGAIKGGLLYMPEYMSVYRYAVPGSFCTRNKNVAGFSKDYNNRKMAMLTQLDIDTCYKYHNTIEARKMLYEVNLDNSISKNIRNFMRYKNGFAVLSHTEKIKILVRLFFPYVLRFRFQLFFKD